MKFRVQVTGVYEVSDDRLEEVYQTSDVNEAARIDEEADPVELFELIESDSLVISVRPERSRS